MISVIIPVYNVEKYLRECIDSAVNQSYHDMEILLIDDGSTDSSAAICEQYASCFPYVRVIHKTNGGLSSARNRGIDEASGNWIIFLDSDDVWADRNCLTKLHDYALSMDLDIVRFEYQAVNDKLEPIEERSYDKSDAEGTTLDNYSLVKYGIAGEWFAVLYLIKRDVLNGIRFNEQTCFQEDIDFYCRLFSEKPLRCGYLNEKMYLYRKRAASITTTSRIGNLKGSFDLCDVFHNSSLITDDIRLRNLYKYNSVMMYYWTLETLAEEPYYSKRSSIIKELQLNDLHKRVMARSNDVQIEWRYRLFIIPAPCAGIKILHLKNKIRSMIG